MRLQAASYSGNGLRGPGRTELEEELQRSTFRTVRSIASSGGGDPATSMRLNRCGRARLRSEHGRAEGAESCWTWTWTWTRIRARTRSRDGAAQRPHEKENQTSNSDVTDPSSKTSWIALASNGAMDSTVSCSNMWSFGMFSVLVRTTSTAPQAPSRSAAGGESTP